MTNSRVPAVVPWLLAAGTIPVLLASSAPSAARVADQETFRGGIELLTIDVQVTPSKDAPFRDFAAADFDVTISGRKRPVASAARVHLDEGPILPKPPQLGPDSAACVFGFHRKTNRTTLHYRLGIAPADTDRGVKDVRVSMADSAFATQWSVWRLPIRLTKVAPAPPPVRQIDHIVIRTGNPSDLHAFFVDVLQLPVAWPLTSPRAGVMTGGVGVGNVNLEAIQFPGQTEPSPRLLGFALEPTALDESVRQLALRGLTVGAPREIVGSRPDGSKGVLWTNVTLPQFSDAENPGEGTVHVFLSEYSAAYVDVGARRARLRQQLETSGGGPLGIVDVKEVVIGVSDVEAARRLWQRLLDPAPALGSDRWQVGAGPAIRLVPAAQNRIEALVIRVASMDRARTFLRANRLLGSETEGQLTIDPSRLSGLDLRLVAK